MRIYILTEDAVFSRMLSLELSGCGFEVSGSVSDADIYLCDLDTCKYSDIKEFSERAEIYGWYRESGEDCPAAQLCACIFRRPFLVSELKMSLEKFASGKEIPTPSQSRVRVSEFGRRKNMLVCNHRACSAVFGSYSIPLSPAEADVLKLLCDRRGEVVSRGEINAIFPEAEGNIGDVYICKLRKKIDNALGVKFIYTVKGKGYMLK